MSDNRPTKKTKNNSGTPKGAKLEENFVMIDFTKERDSVTVMAPATSANLGSGYDTLGLALDLYNEVTIKRAKKFKMTAEGEGADELPLDETNYVCIGVKVAFEAAGKPLPALEYHLKQGIPHARGLGSSSAGIVAGLVGGLTLAGHKLDVQGKESLLQLAAKVENHPDNIAPCIYGGLQMGIYDQVESRWATERINVPNGLVFVAFIPDEKGFTAELRGKVPKKLSVEDAVFNIGRFGWLIQAFANNKLENIRAGLEDRIHQNQRATVHSHRHVQPMIEKCYEAGAVGCYLSGSGPVVMAIVSGGSGDYFTQNPLQRKDAAVARAMEQVGIKTGQKGKVYITHVANTGAVVVKADPPFSKDGMQYNGFT